MVLDIYDDFGITRRNEVKYDPVLFLSHYAQNIS